MPWYYFNYFKAVRNLIKKRFSSANLMHRQHYICKHKRLLQLYNFCVYRALNNIANISLHIFAIKNIFASYENWS